VRPSPWRSSPACRHGQPFSQPVDLGPHVAARLAVESIADIERQLGESSGMSGVRGYSRRGGRRPGADACAHALPPAVQRLPTANRRFPCSQTSGPSCTHRQAATARRSSVRAGEHDPVALGPIRSSQLPPLARARHPGYPRAGERPARRLPVARAGHGEDGH
jgi:hypothetical protein